MIRGETRPAGSVLVPASIRVREMRDGSVGNTGDLVGTLQLDGSSRIMNITSHNTTIEREALINYLHGMKSFVLFLGCHT